MNLNNYTKLNKITIVSLIMVVILAVSAVQMNRTSVGFYDVKEFVTDTGRRAYWAGWLRVKYVKIWWKYKTSYVRF